MRLTRYVYDFGVNLFLAVIGRHKKARHSRRDDGQRGRNLVVDVFIAGIRASNGQVSSGRCMCKRKRLIKLALRL